MLFPDYFHPLFIHQCLGLFCKFYSHSFFATPRKETDWMPSFSSLSNISKGREGGTQYHSLSVSCSLSFSVSDSPITALTRT